MSPSAGYFLWCNLHTDINFSVLEAQGEKKRWDLEGKGIKKKYNLHT